jgi:hypothetical protein
MAKVGRKPTLPEKRLVKKIYLDRANLEFIKTKTNVTEYINKLIERDRLENMQADVGTDVYKPEKMIKG